jgi:hypothetical protein
MEIKNEHEQDSFDGDSSGCNRDIRVAEYGVTVRRAALVV